MSGIRQMCDVTIVIEAYSESVDIVTKKAGYENIRQG
jgi:hypothetical protein